jgi:DNA polymerase
MANTANLKIAHGAQSIVSLRRTAASCRACDLWKHATQTVFGEGPQKAKMMLVGEQPGNKEDLAGRPFVGPAGKLLDDALEKAGIDRGEIYITNLVKHFKWEPSESGKTRIGKKLAAGEIQACRPWLDAELKLIKPRIVILLGATAGQSLLGKTFRVTRQHGQLIDSSLAPYVLATLHPSAILRARGKKLRESQIRSLIHDLTQANRLLKEAA